MTGVDGSRSLTTSRELDRRAQRWLPGGVSGVGRRFSPFPIRFASAKAQHLTDVDGNTYLDLHGGFGTAVLGYAHPEVDAAAIKAITEVGSVVGLPNPYDAALAERLVALIPSAEMVALCGGGGSDACYHAVRLARAATGRNRIVKVEGGYHGWHSDVGVSTQHMPPKITAAEQLGRPEGVPNSAGSLVGVTSEVDIVTVNDRSALAELFKERGDDLAAIIVEPILYSAGCVFVDADYLLLARQLCDKYGTVLIFDEVMTGFRNGLAGAGALSGVTPDLAAYGKAIANGYMIAFLGGKRDLVSLLAPTGPVYYSGTFNGHPVSCAAALKTLELLELGVDHRLTTLTDRLTSGIRGAIDDLGLTATCQGAGGVWSLYFGVDQVNSYRDVFRADPARVDALSERYRLHLLDWGIYLHRRHVNRGFLSTAHSEADIDHIIAATTDFLASTREDLIA